jgi:hypothetical protein
MAHKCTICNSTFSSKSYLNYHQKRTQYCLKMQVFKMDDDNSVFREEMIRLAEVGGVIS